MQPDSDDEFEDLRFKIIGCIFGAILINLWPYFSLISSVIMTDTNIEAAFMVLTLMIYFPMFFLITSYAISSLGHNGGSRFMHGFVTTLIAIILFYILFTIISSFALNEGDDFTTPEMSLILSLLVAGCMGSLLHVVVSKLGEPESNYQDFQYDEDGNIEGINQMLHGIRKGIMNLEIKVENLNENVKSNTSKLESNAIYQLIYGQSNQNDAIKIQNTKEKPNSIMNGVIGDDGYEWLEFPPGSQIQHYRKPGSGEWTIWDK